MRWSIRPGPRRQADQAERIGVARSGIGRYPMLRLDGSRRRPSRLHNQNVVIDMILEAKPRRAAFLGIVRNPDARPASGRGAGPDRVSGIAWPGRRAG